MTRACGVTLLRREKAAWFPAEELRDDNNVQPHKVEISVEMLDVADLMLSRSLR